ncbi:MAG: non-homologous end-joining DNA ligase, partial [Planctomycetota bacterium]
MKKKLATYNEKRRFDATPEPAGAEGRSARAKEDGGLLVIQKHRATRLHYDVRLELDGVLVSWAVPKGPSLDPKDRRLAVHVEDHPLDYKDFEGVIPEGNYGAGEVIVWDQGTWEWSPTPGKTKAKSAADALRRGKLDFSVVSEKLRGRFVLVRTGKDDKSWMLIKVRDEHARPGSDIEAERPESILTGRRVEDLKTTAPGEHRWSSHDGLVTPKQRALPDLKRLLGRSASALSEGDIPFGMQPMLPTLVEALPAGHDDANKWLAEIKLDGVRALAFKKGGEVRLVSRNGNDVTRTFPEVARSIALLPEDAVLDVELCVLDDKGRSRFQLIQPRLHVGSERAIERLARETPAVAFAFDLVQLGAHDLRAVPLEKRKAALGALLPEEDERLRYLSHVAGSAHDFYEVACEHGLEGVVLKRAGSKYESGRTRLWLKVKCARTERLPIGGYVLNAKTSRSSLAGLLLGRVVDGVLHHAGGVGTGFDEKTRRALRTTLEPLVTEKSPFAEPIARRERDAKNVFVRPQLDADVRLTATTDDGKLR